MKKIISYVHFTRRELEEYTRDKSSCVERMNNTIHIDFPPWGMNNFRDSLLMSVATKKIGNFDPTLNGIVLNVRNIKLQGDSNLVRYDAPELHLTIQADFYVFKPRTDAVLKGIVNHVSRGHISVVIYRVFNVSIRLARAYGRLDVGDEITFKVKKFDLQNILPYIEGDLLDLDSIDSGMSTSEEKGDIKKNLSSDYTTGTTDYDSDESERVPKPVVVKTENPNQNSSSSASSDEEEHVDHKAKIRNVLSVQGIKEEPMTPSVSPEKTHTKSRKKRVTIKQEDSDSTQCSRKDVKTSQVVAGASRKQRVKKELSDAEISSVDGQKPRKRHVSLSSDSDDAEVDNSNSVIALMNRIKNEKASGSSSMDEESHKKSHKNNLSLPIDSPQLSSTKIHEKKVPKKSKK